MRSPMVGLCLLGRHFHLKLSPSESILASPMIDCSLHQQPLLSAFSYFTDKQNNPFNYILKN